MAVENPFDEAEEVYDRVDSLRREEWND